MSVANAYKDHVKNLKVSEQLLTKSIAKKTRQRRLKGKLGFTAKIDPQDEVEFIDLHTLKIYILVTVFFFLHCLSVSKNYCDLYFFICHTIPPSFM
jgi:hypothetical protein